MSIKYYYLEYLLNNENRFFIWYSEENDSIEDGVLTLQNKIISFPNLEIIEEIKIKKELDFVDLEWNQIMFNLHDLDYVIKFKGNIYSNYFYGELLSAWNLINDILISIKSKEYIVELIANKYYYNKKRAKRYFLKLKSNILYGEKLKKKSEKIFVRRFKNELVKIINENIINYEDILDENKINLIELPSIKMI